MGPKGNEDMQGAKGKWRYASTKGNGDMQALSLRECERDDIC